MSHLKQPPLKAQVLEARFSGQCSWVPGGLDFSLSPVSPPNHDVGGSVPPCCEASRQHRSKSNNVDSSQRTGLFKPGSLLFETASRSMTHAGSLTLDSLPQPPEFGITGIQHIRLRGGLGRLQSTRRNCTGTHWRVQITDGRRSSVDLEKTRSSLPQGRIHYNKKYVLWCGRGRLKSWVSAMRYEKETRGTS